MKMNCITAIVLVTQLWAMGAFAAVSEKLKIFDVTKVSCGSGEKPNFYRVFPPGAVVQMKEDIIEAFANATSDRDSVILRYPIAKEGLDPSAPPPCAAGDTLLVELKKHLEN